jgi:hypothetical protein
MESNKLFAEDHNSDQVLRLVKENNESLACSEFQP